MKTLSLTEEQIEVFAQCLANVATVSYALKVDPSSLMVNGNAGVAEKLLTGALFFLGSMDDRVKARLFAIAEAMNNEAKDMGSIPAVANKLPC